MTAPVNQNAYLVANATGTIFPTVVFGRAPTNSDFHYPVTQRWIDTADNNREYFLLNFISSNGVVTPNWVILSQGGSTIEFLQGNSGGQVGPDGTSTINIPGTGSITTVGSPGTNTLTVELTGLTNHNVLLGAGTPTIGLAAPSTAGFVLTSNGASADPSFQSISTTGGWTPVLQFGGGTTGIVYVDQLGEYTKIGNVVFFSLLIKISSKGSSTGVVTIAGFPVATLAIEQSMPVVDIQNFTYDAGFNTAFLDTVASPGTVFGFWETGSGVSQQLTNSNFMNNTRIEGNGFYFSS